MAEIVEPEIFEPRLPPEPRLGMVDADELPLIVAAREDVARACHARQTGE